MNDLQRSYDAALLNAVVNHPEVSRWMIGIQPPYDLSAVLANTANVFLANQYGGFLFVRGEVGYRYEVHTQFLPEGRGDSFRFAKQAAWHMFTKTDCLEIETYVPKENAAAWGLTVAMSFKPCGEIEVNGHDCTVFVLNIKTWAMSLCQQQD